MIPKRDASRLRRLLQRRIVQFEARLKQTTADDTDATPPPAELEREARALIALMKALQTAADMETASATEADRQHADIAEDALRRRLAQQLEALCAPSRPPCRQQGVDT